MWLSELRSGCGVGMLFGGGRTGWVGIGASGDWFARSGGLYVSFVLERRSVSLSLSDDFSLSLLPHYAKSPVQSAAKVPPHPAQSKASTHKFMPNMPNILTNTHA